MKFWFDTEFCEAGPHKPIDLISIGMVAQDGRTLYCISSEFDENNVNDWVKANVITQLGTDKRKPLAEIAILIMDFCDPEKYGKPEFYGYYADYDWVVFCQIFGTMMDLPKGFPMYCRDIKQMADGIGNPKLPEQGKDEHNALADAKWNKVAYDFVIDQIWKPKVTA